MLLLAALKLSYCTPDPEWIETMPKVSDWALGAAEAEATREVAKRRFLICIMARCGDEIGMKWVVVEKME